MLNSAQTSRISLVSVETDRGTVDSGVSMSMPGASFSLPSRDRVEKMPLLTQRHSAVRRRQVPPPPPPYPGPHTTISTCSSSCRCSSASHASSDSYLSSHRVVSAPASLPSSSRSSMNGSGSAAVQVPAASISSFIARNTPSAPPPSLPSQTVSPGLPPRLTLRPSVLHDFQRHHAPGSFMTSLTCEACGQPINQLSDACQAMGIIYHNKCFVCCICSRTLRGRTYYSDRGRAYCEEDYRYCGFQHSAERCCGCGHIITETILTALGKSYHPGCFRCSVCQKCLDGERFTVDVNSQVFCIRDYHRMYAPKCGRCRLPIMPIAESDDVIRVVAMDRDFHIDCYKCEVCGLQLTDEPERRCYPLQDGSQVRLLCRRCHPGRVARSPPSSCTALPRRTLLM